MLQSPKKRSSPNPLARTPPHFEEVERALLGAMMLSREVIERAMPSIQSDSFYIPKHKLIWLAVKDLFEAEQVVDYHSVYSMLQTRSQAKKGLTLADISELADRLPTVANAAQYVDLLNRAAYQRRAIVFFSEALDEAFGVEEPAAWQGSIEKRLLELRGKEQAGAKASKPADTLTRYLKRVEGIMLGETPPMYSTGLHSLDAATGGGFGPQQLIVIGGVPGSGKSSLAAQIARCISQREKRTSLLFSMEMSELEVMQRAICSMASVTEHQLLNRNLLEQVTPKLSRFFEDIAAIDLRIVDDVNMGLHDVEAQARALALEGNSPAVIVVDYLQLMRTSERHKDRRDLALAEITRGLKNLSRELHCTVILLSQLNRDYKKRSSRKPGLSDFKDSGAIEADADKMIIVHRQCLVDDQFEDDGEAELLIVKQRQGGGVGSVRLAFVGKHFRFQGLEG